MKDNIIKENEDYKDIELRGFDYNYLEEEEGGGGSIGIIKVSLFYSSNSVVSRVLCQADGKMNEVVDNNNRLYKSVGGEIISSSFYKERFLEMYWAYYIGS